jgi:hypothetical protein
MTFHRTFAACGMALAALAACGDTPTGGGSEARVQLRFGVEGAASSAALLQTGGTGGLTITGANGTLRIDDIRLVVAEFELDGDDDVNRCGADDDGTPDQGGGNDDDGSGDDCEDFQAGPLFIDLPLNGGASAVASGNVPAGVYDEVEFEVEDLDDDEEDPAERARIQALRQQILAQFPDWPRDASMLVVGSFTPTGGAARPFWAFVEAEIEIETQLSPPLTVGAGESRSVEVTLDPAAIFRDGANVLDLSSAGGRLELEIEIENGFRTRTRVDD